jgi:sialic acid synthase SpsE
MVQEVHKVEAALGHISYEISGNPLTKFKARRSLYISKDLKKGDILTAENIKSVRPSWGMHPRHYESMLGKKVSQDIPLGTRLSLALLDGK